MTDLGGFRVLVTGVGGPAGCSLSRQLIARGHTVVGTDMQSIDRTSPAFQAAKRAQKIDFAALLDS